MTQSKTTKQKNKRGDRKGDSNDSPEIPDREGEHGGGGDIRQPRTPLGGGGQGEGNEAMSKLPAKVASSRMNPRRDGHTETRTTRAKRSR